MRSNLINNIRYVGGGQYALTYRGKEYRNTCTCELVETVMREQKLFDQAMADADMGTKIADMIFGKVPEKKE
jgi:hypothetical protein|tara:strand:- start:197 stop:412 length:216 start_codon:yes stop_codon:yes gene_type:complete